MIIMFVNCLIVTLSDWVMKWLTTSKWTWIAWIIVSYAWCDIAWILVPRSLLHYGRLTPMRMNSERPWYLRSSSDLTRPRSLLLDGLGMDWLSRRPKSMVTRASLAASWLDLMVTWARSRTFSSCYSSVVDLAILCAYQDCGVPFKFYFNSRMSVHSQLMGPLRFS